MSELLSWEEIEKIKALAEKHPKDPTFEAILALITHVEARERHIQAVRVEINWIYTKHEGDLRRAFDQAADLIETMGAPQADRPQNAAARKQFADAVRALKETVQCSS